MGAANALTGPEIENVKLPVMFFSTARLAAVTCQGASTTFVAPDPKEMVYGVELLMLLNARISAESVRAVVDRTGVPPPVSVILLRVPAWAEDSSDAKVLRKVAGDTDVPDEVGVLRM